MEINTCNNAWCVIPLKHLGYNNITINTWLTLKLQKWWENYRYYVATEIKEARFYVQR